MSTNLILLRLAVEKSRIRKSCTAIVTNEITFTNKVRNSENYAFLSLYGWTDGRTDGHTLIEMHGRI